MTDSPVAEGSGAHRVVEQVAEQHAEEAAFHWIRRNVAVSAPHYSLPDVAKLDDRVEAHLDGLRIAGDPGWEIAARELAWKEPGEVFAAGVLALESGNADRITAVRESAVADPELARGLVSALGWLEGTRAWPVIEGWLGEEDPAIRAIALRGAAAHRFDPGARADLRDWRADPRCRAAMVRCLAELGRVDRMSDCLEGAASDDAAVRFWSVWSSALLGGPEHVSILKEAALGQEVFTRRALSLAGRTLSAGDVRAWQLELSATPETLRASVQLAGILGDPVLIPWLLEQMAVDEVARVAGESFTLITGVDLAYDDLERDQPEDFEAGPTEEPEDEDVSMDDDEDLPWPDPALIEKWWSQHASGLQAHQRYLLGQPIGLASLQEALRSGTQRQRAAAALELKLLRPDQPLFEVRAPGFRQQASLGVR